jgi:hypothetical protein
MPQSFRFLSFLLSFFKLTFLLFFKTFKCLVLFLDSHRKRVTCLVCLSCLINTISIRLYLGKRLRKYDVSLGLKILNAVKLGNRLRNAQECKHVDDQLSQEPFELNTLITQLLDFSNQLDLYLLLLR